MAADSELSRSAKRRWRLSGERMPRAPGDMGMLSAGYHGSGFRHGAEVESLIK